MVGIELVRSPSSKEPATGEAGDACREHAIEEATAAHTDGGEKLGVLFPYLRGINTDLMYHTADSRPVRVLESGEPVHELF